MIRSDRKLGGVIVGFLLGYLVRHLLEDKDTSVSQTQRYDLQDGWYGVKEDVDLLVLIVSAPGNLHLRNTIRQTWASKPVRNTRAFFVVGTIGLNAAQLNIIEDESRDYNDVILLTVEDSYRKLTHKVVKMWEYVESRFRAKFALKVEDDTYVQLDLLKAELDKLIGVMGREQAKMLYWGYFDGRAPVVRKGLLGEENYNLCDRYIPFALGGGYVLGSKIVSLLASAARLSGLMEFHKEDVSVGAWLAGLNTHRMHDVRFDTERQSRGCQNDFLVTHNQNRESMLNMWKRVEQNLPLCVKENLIRASYEYNWEVPPTQCCKRE